MSADSEQITLQTREVIVEIALAGAEPVSWRIDGRELLWQRDPVWWDRSAPILFPVVGASQGGHVLVAGRAYPMPLHGFGKDSIFRLVERGRDFAHLRLQSDGESHQHYPFDFTFDVRISLAGRALQLSFEITNCGKEILPYAIGFHPGFYWNGGGGLISFEAIEDEHAPHIAAQGLISRRHRALPLRGRILPLSSDSFADGALVFRHSRSREMIFTDERDTIRLRAEGFRHLAVWSRPSAPFLCLEAWTSHADWEDFRGELTERNDMIMLAPERSGRHNILLEFLPDTTLEKQPKKQD